MIKNRSKIVVKGLNQERAINNISKHINIYNFSREQANICQFEVDFNKKKTAQKLIKEQGLEILSISHYGAFNFFKNSVLRPGILLGIIFSFLIYFVQYFFVWKIEVNGTDNQQITLFLKDKLDSRLKSQIDTKKMEILIKNNFEDVSSISIAIIGQSLVANVNSAVLPEQMKSEHGELVCQQDGLITKINLIQGTLNCKVGDIVKKGDVLVYPYVVDSQGEKRAVKPKAEIFADVWIGASTNHYDYQIKKQHTGNKIETSKVYLNNLLIYKNNKDVNFQEYEIETKEKFLTNNLFLPFKMIKTTYYETKIVEIIEPFEEQKEKIIENTRQKALIFLQKNEIIKEENFTIRDETNMHIVSYVITVSTNIGG